MRGRNHRHNHCLLLLMVPSLLGCSDERAWFEGREVHPWDLEPPEKDAVALEKMEICLFPHRDQIHRWKRKTSCPTNMLSQKTCFPLIQEPSDWKGLAKISTIPKVKSIQEGWAPGKGRSEGGIPVGAASSCSDPRNSSFWGGDPLQSRCGLYFGGVCFSLWL